jgi:hypothetical protein
MCEKVFYDSIDLHQFRCFFFSFCKTNKEESIETRVGIKIGERNVKAPPTTWSRGSPKGGPLCGFKIVRRK